MNQPRKMGRPRHEVPSYDAAHSRVYNAFGKASDHLCIGCLGPACQWAYVGDDSDPERLTETVVRSGNDRAPKTVLRTYSTDLSLYQPMCSPCHNGMDRPVTCGHDASRARRRDAVKNRRNGRSYTESQRYCLDCRAEARVAGGGR